MFFSTNPFLSVRFFGLHVFTISLIAHSSKIQPLEASSAGRIRGTANWHMDIFLTISCWRNLSEQWRRAHTTSRGFTESDALSMLPNKASTSNSWSSLAWPVSCKIRLRAVPISPMSFWRNYQGTFFNGWGLIILQISDPIFRTSLSVSFEDLNFSSSSFCRKQCSDFSLPKAFLPKEKGTKHVEYIFSF